MAAANNKQSSDDDSATLKEDFERLRSDFQTLRSHLRDMGERRVNEAGAQGREQLDEIDALLRSFGSDLRARGELGQARVEDTIRERPLTSILAAFGLGMLISLLIGRGRH